MQSLKPVWHLRVLVLLLNGCGWEEASWGHPVKSGLSSLVLEADIPPPAIPNLANLPCSASVWSVGNALLHWKVWLGSEEPDCPRLNPVSSPSPVVALTSVETWLQSELFTHLYKQSLLIICWFYVWEFAYNLFITPKLILVVTSLSLDHMLGSRNPGSSGTYVTNWGKTRHRSIQPSCCKPVFFSGTVSATFCAFCWPFYHLRWPPSIVLRATWCS